MNIEEILNNHKKWLNDEEDGIIANLRGANLCGANLSMAENLLSAITYIKDNFETTDKGIIAYKTFGSQYTPPEKWVIQLMVRIFRSALNCAETLKIFVKKFTTTMKNLTFPVKRIGGLIVADTAQMALLMT